MGSSHLCSREQKSQRDLLVVLSERFRCLTGKRFLLTALGAMAHQSAVANFVAILNRLYNTNFKPNHVDARELFDKCCAKEATLR